MPDSRLSPRPRLERLPLRTTAMAITLGLATGLAGCTTNPEPTPSDLDAVNLGANAVAGEVAIDNLLLVTRGEGDPARVLGTLTNSSPDAVSVTLSDSDDSVVINLGPEEVLRLSDNEVLFTTSDEPPGARAPIMMSTPDASATEIFTPVRDGSLEWLEPYVP